VNNGLQNPDQLQPHRRADIWERWQRGRVLKLNWPIDRHFKLDFGLLEPTGGIRHRTTVPAGMTLAGAEEISRAFACDLSLLITAGWTCAQAISRELHRNGGATGCRAVKADQTAWDPSIVKTL
jgi:hypothetical protein